MESEQPQLVTLADLLLGPRTVPVATLASCIEQQGIHEWDRFGRLQYRQPDSAEAKIALDLLAQQWAHEDEADLLSPVDQDQGDSAFSCFGWPQGQLPDFAKVSIATPVATERPQSVRKSDNAHLAIIGMLLRYIRGERTGRKHPDYTSDAQLIAALGDARDEARYQGISKSNLEAKFAAAKKVLKDAEG